MIRLSRCGAISAVLVALSANGIAFAQTAPIDQTQQAQNKETRQAQFDREKVTMKDQVQEAINSSNANIDALKNKSHSDKGDLKKRDDDMQKQLTMLNGHLKDDLTKIDHANVNDWEGVRTVLDRDLNAIDTKLQEVAAVTNVPTPRVGVTNQQPSK